MLTTRHHQRHRQQPALRSSIIAPCIAVESATVFCLTWATSCLATARTLPALSYAFFLISLRSSVSSHGKPAMCVSSMALRTSMSGVSHFVTTTCASHRCCKVIVSLSTECHLRTRTRAKQLSYVPHCVQPVPRVTFIRQQEHHCNLCITCGATKIADSSSQSQAVCVFALV